jgi:hypothetical protein
VILSKYLCKPRIITNETKEIYGIQSIAGQWFKSCLNNIWHKVEFKYTHTDQNTYFRMKRYKSWNPAEFDIWPLNFSHVSMIPEEPG